MTVLLATCEEWPEGEPGAAALDAALAARGVDARWVPWDDDAVDWAAADLVAVRSTWDYIHRPDELLAWARQVETTTALLNGADVFAWNVDKAYLTALGDVPVVPTVALDGRAGLARAVAAVGGPAVVKPRISASGHGVMVVAGPDDPRLGEVGDVPVVVQPLVESIRTEGEHSVFVLDGRACSRIRKIPPADDIRAHEDRGATVTAVPLTTTWQRWPSARSRSRRDARPADRLRAARPAAAGRGLVRRRARGHRARPLSRRPSLDGGALRGPGGRATEGGGPTRPKVGLPCIHR